MKYNLRVLFLAILCTAQALVPTQVQLSSKTTPIPSVVHALAQNTAMKAADKITMFIQDCKRDSVNNKNIPQHTQHDGLLRLMTYNVHFWMDPYIRGGNPEIKPLHHEILNMILKLNPDVVVLQEVTLDGNEFTPKLPDFKEQLIEACAKMGYKYTVWQPLIPTKGDSMFGNMIISKFPLQDTKHIYTIDEKNEEKRGYINVKVAGISLYGTHLDVWDETEKSRMSEMGELVDAMNKDTNANVVLLGDLNAARKQDHLYEVNGKTAWKLLVADDRARLSFDTPTGTLDMLASNGYTDCFTWSKIATPKYTVWSGKVVDFIMLKKSWNLPIAGCYPYYDGTSDHIPLIIDIKTNVK